MVDALWRARARALHTGFTLLEVVLAISLSVVLLAALYLTMNMHYSHARAGRELTDEAAIVRSVVNRISDDIQGQLSPMNALLYAKVNGTTIMGNPFGGSYGKSSQGGSSQNGSQGGNSSQNNSTQNSSSKTSSNNSTSAQGGSGQSGQGSGQGGSQNSQASASTPPSMVVFNLGVYGDADRLVLTGSWLPKDLTRLQEGQSQTSDLRRVVYWLVKEGNKKGLARQELTAVTGSDAGQLPPEVPDPASHVIAPEITKFRVEYFDGTEWQTTWDGTELDSSSSLPIGPPSLIAINITVSTPTGRAGEKAKETNIRHVIAIPSANVAATASP